MCLIHYIECVCVCIGMMLVCGYEGVRVCVRVCVCVCTCACVFFAAFEHSVTPPNNYVATTAANGNPNAQLQPQLVINAMRNGNPAATAANANAQLKFP